VGHGGTLDPAVTGVLPLAVGGATRLLPYLDGTKEYLGRLKLGTNTDSDDLSGTVLKQRPWPQLDAATLETALAPFRGTIQQRPPQISAVHVDGQRAHARARRGEELQLQLREVNIHELELLHWDQASGELAIRMRCSAGTYVRSLARDLGELLGCGGCLAQLRRTEALGFGLHHCLSLESLEQGTSLLDPLTALGHLPSQMIASEDWLAWSRGQRLPLLEQADPSKIANDSVVVMLRPNGSLAGMARICDQNQLQPRLVLDAAG
jgi:tRNA pseudouridine55 synthase